MIRSTFFGLEIGKTGLFVSQYGLDVTGHNVANVDTAGYTRQRIINTAIDPYNGTVQFKPIGNALIGAGALTIIHDQVRDSFLDKQFRNQQTLYSYWATRTQGLNYVEALFENPDEDATLEAILNGLFEAFNTVNDSAPDREQRTYLMQQAIKVSEQFNHMYDSLIDQQKDQNLAVETIATQINNIAAEIAFLNKSIYAFEIDGNPANDLRDKRNLLVDQLSSLADIEYTGDAIGSKFTLKIAGETLVSHTSYNELAVRKEDNVLGGPPEYEQRNVICWASDDPDPANWEALDLGKLKGGELLAHINLRDSITQSGAGIPYFINQLNTLAQTLVQVVNQQHRQGYTHPASGQSQQGVNFFYEDYLYDSGGNIVMDADGNPMYDVSSVSAGNIRISDELEESVYNIAASDSKITLDGDSETLQAGNNKNGLAMFALYQQQGITLKVMNPAYDHTDPTSQMYLDEISVGTLGGHISSTVIDVAITLNHSKSMTSTQETLLLSADTQRTSVAGVSLDEEMTNLIKYNHAYSGASRVITAMDEALEILINKMGRVGL